MFAELSLDWNCSLCMILFLFGSLINVSGVFKHNNCAQHEGSLQLSGIIVDAIRFNLRCGGVLSLLTSGI